MSEIKSIPRATIPDSLQTLADILDVDQNGKINRKDFRTSGEFEVFKDMVERTAEYERGPQFLAPSDYKGKTVVVDPSLGKTNKIVEWAQELSGKKPSQQLRKRKASVVVVKTGSSMHLQAISRKASGEAIEIVSKTQLSEAVMASRAGHLEFGELESIAEDFLRTKIAPYKGWEEAEVFHTYDATDDWALSLKFGLYYDRDEITENDLVKIDFAVGFKGGDDDVGIAMDRRTGKVLEVYVDRDRIEGDDF